MPPPVIARFAPSPTGFLHIGGARTALFNWLFTKNRGGTLLLRIEDTDRERSTPEAVTAILDGLTWLGIGWEGTPVSQYSRVERHRDVVRDLLAKGHAYRCYCTPEELEAMRAQALAAGRQPRYDGTWRDRDPSEAPSGVKPAIRFKSPIAGETIIEDQVLGSVTFQNKELDDLIILRSDENPTYNLSVVVDDHDMAISHIIRGVDHLTNAARQVQIYRALDWNIPIMAHIPLIHGPDGAKLSKRHGALGVDAYRAMGYLPEAMRNYLVRLGWSHGDDEIFTTEQMIEWFGLDHIGKAPARFDFARLENLNGHYMRTSSDEALLEALINYLPYAEGGPELLPRLNSALKAKLLLALPGLKERAKTLQELFKSAQYLFMHPHPDAKAQALLTGNGFQILGNLLPALRRTTDWTSEALDADLRAAAESSGLKFGQIAQPLRAALTGSTTSPGIFDVMVVLGKDETLARIEKILGQKS